MLSVRIPPETILPVPGMPEPWTVPLAPVSDAGRREASKESAVATRSARVDDPRGGREEERAGVEDAEKGGERPFLGRECRLGRGRT